MTIRQVYPSNVASLPPFYEKKSHQNFDCNRGVDMYFSRVHVNVYKYFVSVEALLASESGK